MPRPLRIEYPGAIYHVINRGNYRQNLFDTHRTAEAFEKALFEAADRFGWVVHAYVVMSNHYHLALETPRSNLSAGMQWMQSVFSNRFNRFTKERGHVFQGRYKALLVQSGSSLARVVDYIHLNPVRAGIVRLEELRSYQRSSFPKWFETGQDRPHCLRDHAWRSAAGYGEGEGELRRYWSALAGKLGADAEEEAKIEKEVCRGWFVGEREWAVELILQFKRGTLVVDAGTEDEDCEETWELLARRYLAESGHSEADLKNSRLSAPWKLELAWKIKSSTGATNRWLAQRLHLGHPYSASLNISRWRTSTII